MVDDFFEVKLPTSSFHINLFLTRFETAFPWASRQHSTTTILLTPEITTSPNKMASAHNHPDRIVIHTGAAAGEVDKICSLERIVRRVDDLLTGNNEETLRTAKEFLIVGRWIYSPDDVDKIEEKFGKLEPQVPLNVDAGSVRTGDLTRSRSQSDAASSNDVLQKHELEWNLAVRKIKTVLAKMFELTTLR